MNIPRARRFPYRPRRDRSRSVLANLTGTTPLPAGELAGVARTAGLVINLLMNDEAIRRLKRGPK